MCIRDRALGNRACTAECPAGRYSLEPGLYAATQCKPCPPGLRTGQCEDPHITRKGFFDSTSGEINENAHAYIIDNEAVARPGDRSPFDFGPKDTPSGTFWVGAGGFVGGKQAEGRPNPTTGRKFELNVTRSSPAPVGAVTSKATYGTFLESLLRARGRGNGVHFV